MDEDEIKELMTDALKGTPFEGMDIEMASDAETRRNWRGVEAILGILNVEKVAFLSDFARVGEFDTTDEELAAMPVCGVTRDMTLLEALHHIRKTHPAWPGRLN